MKRQRGRNRGGGNMGGQGGGSSGGGKPQQNANRAFDSNGPENIKVRGHAQHIFEKYQQLARDATSGGDRVLAENYLQHAEHYFRVVRSLQPNRPAADIMGRDSFNSGFDMDFEDENGNPIVQEEADAPVEADSQGQDDRDNRPDRDRADRDNRSDRDRQGGYRQDGQRQDGQRSEGQRQDGQRQDGQPRQDSNGRRDERPRYEGRRDRYEPREGEANAQPREGNRDANRDGNRENGRRERFENRGERTFEPRENGRDNNRSDAPRPDGARYERQDQPVEARDPLAVIEPQAQPLPRQDREPRTEREPRAERAPRAEREPRTEREPATSMLRSGDGDMSHAPAFLQAPMTAPAPTLASEDAPVKRGRGRPRKVVVDAPVGEEV